MIFPRLKSNIDYSNLVTLLLQILRMNIFTIPIRDSDTSDVLTTVVVPYFTNRKVANNCQVSCKLPKWVISITGS